VTPVQVKLFKKMDDMIINKVNLDEDFMVYPNPVKEDLNILVPASKDMMIVEIFDLQGIKVRAFMRDHYHKILSVDVSSLTTGVYIVRVRNEEKQIGVVSIIKE